MVLEAAKTDRLLGSWAVTPEDPNDQYADAGTIAAARGEWLYDSDPIGKAIVETILQGVVGHGLIWHSQYQANDGDEAITPAEQAVRRKARRSLQNATRGTRFDAAGSLTRADMSRVVLAGAVMTGDAWSLRQFLPRRAGRQVQGTCWRIVHSSRISNPHFGPNTDRLVNGIELDENGAKAAVHVLSHHPAALDAKNRYVWKRVPWYDADGWPLVSHLTCTRRADQLRSPTWFHAVVPLLRFLGRTLEAKVIADTLKASMGLIVECEDPEAFAAADRNGAVLNGSTKIVPGKTYYVRTGTKWSMLNFQYQGEDFQKWSDVLLQLVCAAFRVPFEFVLQRMTQTSLAASRVGLLQAYATFHTMQDWLIQYVEEPWNHSVLREDLARGRLVLDGADEIDALDRLLVGSYLRPARPMPDPLKEAQAADHWVKRLGRDYSGPYADAGLDFESSVVVREQNDSHLEKHNVVVAGDPKTDPNAGAQAGRVAPASAPNQTAPKADAAPAEDDEKPAAEEQPQEQGANA